MGDANMSTTIAGTVFAKSSTRTVAQVAEQYKGKLVERRWVFPDNSVLQLDNFGCIAYCSAYREEYPK